MSGKVGKLEEKEFEEWIIKNYPDIFSEWENEYSEFMDIDCFIYDRFPGIFNEWLDWFSE